MLGVDALRRLLDRQPLSVGPDDLALPGVDAGMFQCVEHQIERLDRLLSLGCVHPFEESVDDRIVLEGGFRAPLAHWMRIAPPVPAVVRLTIESSSITRDSASQQ
jgi:hypothetical protein